MAREILRRGDEERIPQSPEALELIHSLARQERDTPLDTRQFPVTSRIEPCFDREPERNEPISKSSFHHLQRGAERFDRHDLPSRDLWMVLPKRLSDGAPRGRAGFDGDERPIRRRTEPSRRVDSSTSRPSSAAYRRRSTAAANDGPLGQARTDEGHRLLNDGALDEIRPRGCARGEPDVIAPEPDALDEEHAAMHVELDAQIGQISQSVRENARPPGGGDRIRQTERKRGLAATFQRRCDLPQLGKQGPRSFEERGRVVREAQTPPLWNDDEKSNGTLQGLDAFAHRGLGQAQPNGRFAYGPESLEGDQGFDSVEYIPLHTE